MTKKTGNTYEKLTQKLYQQIVDLDTKDYKKIEVKHNVKIKGKSGLEHQIDVFWEFVLGSVHYSTIIEVKDWKSKVKKSDLMAFTEKLKDIPGFPTGIYVSKSGFQSGAVEWAKVNGIKLVIIEESQNINHLILKYTINSPHIENFNILFDKEWLAKEFKDSGITPKIRINKSVGDSVLIDEHGKTTPLLHYIRLAQAPFYDTLKSKQKEHIKYYFDNNQYLLIENSKISKVLIEGFEFDFFIIKHEDQIEIHPDWFADYILKDLSDGSQIGFNEKHGVVKTNSKEGKIN